MLKKPQVQAEIARLVRYEGGITKELCEADLLTVRDLALKAGDYQALGQNAMDRAKLAGFITTKQEVHTVTDEQRSALRLLVSSAMRPLTPSLPPSAGTESAPMMSAPDMVSGGHEVSEPRAN